MAVSQKMKQYAQNSSWIRRMFEEGARLKELHGAENVYDFSLGNPDMDPPKAVLDTLASLSTAMYHGYMPNAGYPEVRQAIAEFVCEEYEVRIGAESIIMTCGAGGGLNVVLRAILDPGDEVIALAPYFVEYGFYADNHGGKLVVAPCGADFLPDIEKIRAAITPRTRAIIINNPNNPSGRVYPAQTLIALAGLLKDYPDILVISDEPYRRMAYDGIEVPSVIKHIPNSVVVTSASKDLSLAGERIGFIALGPGAADREELMGAMVMANRILGFVNAPAIFQKVLAACIRETVALGFYKRRRDQLCSICDQAGLQYAPPEGTFYLFVKSPIADDTAFSRALIEERVLVVPGTGFGWPGYVRFAYCTKEATIAGAAEGIKRCVAKLRSA